EAEQIERYLLGTLGEDEQKEIENRLFEDDQFLDRLELAEDDLIESYVRQRLSSADRVGFEHHFLQSPRRRQLTEMAALMWRVWGNVVEPAEPQPRAWYAWLFESPFGRAVPAIAALTLVVLF